MPDDKDILLDIQHLSIGFESYNAKLEKTIFMAIKDLNLTLEKGKILAIVGSSGSGKSLLAHAIMDILPENAKVGGKIYYKEKELTQKIIQHLRGKEIAFIPQSIAYLDPLMTVGNQVRGIYGNNVREMQEKLFKQFNLTNDVERLYPFQLSGGMARRILLSTALVTNTELLIADEPTPGLDLDTALTALKEFRQLADEGKSIIIITHDIDLAINIADSIAIFHDGCVIETAATSSFSGNGDGLKHPYSRALFKALPQNGFHIDNCSICGSSSANWPVSEKEMRCGCEYS